MIENLLKKNLTRMEILKTKIENENLKNINIGVYRNHSFENMEGMINKFLNISNLNAKFFYSDYDDSFNFFQFDTDIDLNIIWIDLTRYKNIDIEKWLCERIESLKQISKKPILIYYVASQNINFNYQNIVIANSKNIENELKEGFLDEEKFEYSGTRLSSKALIKIAQELGLKYLPSFFLTPIKAVVTDMDNTFYKGIIGEDGIENIVPDIEYQKQLKNLKDKGVLLAIASKNEFEDVKELFEKRKDFILKWEDFSSHNISWDSKDKAILEVSKKFNIGVDSILFIDDNIGEVNLVETSLKEVKTLLADENLTYKVNLYPLLERYMVSKEDNLRASDIEANQKRLELMQGLNQDEYFKKLEMELCYDIDNPQNFERAIQLLNKTNQFIFSYKRYQNDEIKENQHILTISLKDKLSDSGIIGIVVSHNENNQLYIDECTISCRALGRNIEDLMLNSAFQMLAQELKTNNQLIIDFKSGPRNNPAKTWLEKYCAKTINNDMLINTVIKDIKRTPYIKII